MKLTFPLKNRYRISARYGKRIHPITKKPQYHNGLDFVAPIGSRVVAVFDGIIVKTWEDALNGKAIRLMSMDNHYRAGYAHLHQIFVQAGDIVNAGDCIAYSGNTGRSTGPHLHLSIYRSAIWETVDPQPML